MTIRLPWAIWSSMDTKLASPIYSYEYTIMQCKIKSHPFWFIYIYILRVRKNAEHPPFSFWSETILLFLALTTVVLHLYGKYAKGIHTSNNKEKYYQHHL
jgi:hypothetical protein